MKVILEPVEFDWDGGNAEKSLKKHKIDRGEAESLFGGSEGLVLPDEKHSQIEKRFLIFCRSNKERYLFVSFTIRGKKVRIISARRMHKKEVAKYEEIQKNIK